ncbi:hypothetical protein K466DRAFT_535726 [Polyporus arcularius HHB13444]|uniref:SigF-like NTF2-like domain-containing protein n=1 Tax=Polyporus arcularius HHB13444 TaxID=1314778 RepID=A0A5C3PXA3_9APHY|nr:hypothetical protein K466DRAFT_535726 [Polyporus arcularius HHB13444]
MEDPANEITNVITLLTAAVNPEIQKAAVLKYYARDMSFRHPLCIVPSAPNSRDAMLSILQWYRILSPMIKGNVSSVTYDEEKHIVFLDVTQIFHIRWSPLNPAPARLIIRLKLRLTPSPSDGSKTVYLIEEQEDFYHPDDIAALLLPPLIPVVRLALRAATFACKVNARVFGALGYWTVRDGEGGQGVALRPEGEPLPPVGENEEIELQPIGVRKDKKND